MPGKAALLIGINYIMDPTNRLNGCCNDVVNMAGLLVEKFGFDKKDVVVVGDMSPRMVAETTKEAIMKKIYNLALKSWIEDLDLVYFQYSGHGTQQRDFSGDEADGLDEGICPADFAMNGIIIDDDLNAVFKSFNPKTKVVCVFDCCHSGSILDLPFCEGVEGKVCGDASGYKGEVLMMSGCVDRDTSADAFEAGAYGGALTNALLKVLRGGSCMIVDIQRKVIDMLMRGGYPQRPVISSSRALTEDVKFL